MSYPQYPYGQQPYGQQPGYPPMGGQPPHPGGPPGPPPMTSAPSTIRSAKWVMWVGAVLMMLYTPAAALDMRVLDSAEWEDVATEVSDSTADGIFLFVMGIGVLVSLVFALLWVLIAHYSAKGAEWARITGTILFGLWVLGFLCGLLSATIGFALLVNVLLVLVGAVATLLLWLPDSSAWFRQHKAPRH